LTTSSSEDLGNHRLPGS